ncbi:MAG: hypothetical protein AAGH76_16240 [Pseudomonadota bacterium]
MNRLIPLLLLIAGVAVGSYILLKSQQSTPTPVEIQEPGEPIEPVESPVAKPAVVNEPASYATATPAPRDEACLDKAAIFEAMTADRERARNLGLAGPDFEALRSIDANGLTDLATQGNSAAMVVMAYEQILKAEGIDTGGDVSATMDQGQAALQRFASRSNKERFADPNRLLALQEANYQLYEAALHGRPFALATYGEVIGAQVGGAVGLRWLTQEEYDSLPLKDRQEYAPSAIYQLVAMRLVFPEINLTHEMPEPLNDRYQALIDELYAEYVAAATDADLDPPTPMLTPAEMEALRRKACAEDAAILWPGA